jgi:3-hydroxyacyl-CoA dehydrogenase, NAD binding domain/CHRD domain
MEILQVCVVGAGTMGRRMAVDTALHGIATALTDVDANLLDDGRRFDEGWLAGRVAKGKLEAQRAGDARRLLRYQPELERAERCDPAVEAIVEDLELKRQMFAGLDAIVPRRAILATNRSTIVLSKLASASDETAKARAVLPDDEEDAHRPAQGSPASSRTACCTPSPRVALYLLDEGVDTVDAIGRIASSRRNSAGRAGIRQGLVPLPIRKGGFMNRTLGWILSLALAACASSQSTSGSTPSSGSKASGQTFTAQLDSASEVPPPNVGSASPSGTATFTRASDTLQYRLSATGLTSPVTAAHIHLGGPGVAGPVIVPLSIAPGSGEGTAQGEGTIDASQIKGKNPDGSPMSMDDLLKAMRNNETYVNIHTQNNKPGEVRGAIRAQGS